MIALLSSAGRAARASFVRPYRLLLQFVFATALVAGSSASALAQEVTGYNGGFYDVQVDPNANGALLTGSGILTLYIETDWLPQETWGYSAVQFELTDAAYNPLYADTWVEEEDEVGWGTRVLSRDPLNPVFFPFEVGPIQLPPGSYRYTLSIGVWFPGFFTQWNVTVIDFPFTVQ